MCQATSITCTWALQTGWKGVEITTLTTRKGQREKHKRQKTGGYLAIRIRAGKPKRDQLWFEVTG